MSRIGDYNLQLQEQANELGYETIQEALDDGCKVEPNEARLITPLEQKIDAEKDGRKKAHEAWLKEKREVLEGLQRLADFYGGIPNNHDSIEIPAIVNTAEVEATVKRAIEFIERGEI